MEFIKLTRDEFNEYALSYADANLWQSLDMAELREKSGFESDFVGVKNEGVLVSVAYLSYRTIQFGYKQYQSPRGFLIDYENKELLSFFITNLKSYLKHNKALYLQCEPYIPYQEHALNGEVVEDGFNNKVVVENLLELGFSHDGFTTGIDLYREPRWIYTIDLNKSEEELLASFERKCKRSVMKTIKYKITTRELNKETLSEFINVMKHTSKRRDFDNRSDEYYHHLYDTFVARGHAKYLSAIVDVDNYIASIQEDRCAELKIVEDCDKKLLSNPNSTKMNNKRNVALDVIARYDIHIQEAQELKEKQGKEIVLSSGVFFVYGKEILCLFSGVYDEYMQFASPYAMHWQMMKYGIEHGYDRYNLYGISGIFDKSAEDYGVYEFKKGFNGEVIELVGKFELVINKPMYGLYKTIKR